MEEFGVIRGLCHDAPSVVNFVQLLAVMSEVLKGDVHYFSSVVFPYVIEFLDLWPTEVIHHELVIDRNYEVVPKMFFLMEDMFDAGVDVRCGFVREYLMRAASIWGPSNLNRLHNVPSLLEERLDYKFDLGDVLNEHLRVCTILRRLLVRYMMRYEQDEASWEALYCKYITGERWSELSSEGAVKPQHGLFPCELEFIQRESRMRFPQTVYDFYRLFGRFSRHAFGNADIIINPYTYGLYDDDISEDYVLFLQEDQGGWAWGYRRDAVGNPEMMLFDVRDDNGYGKNMKRLRHEFGGWEYVAEYQIRFEEFVQTDRYPDVIR